MRRPSDSGCSLYIRSYSRHLQSNNFNALYIEIPIGSFGCGCGCGSMFDRGSSDGGVVAAGPSIDETDHAVRSCNALVKN